jgi:hypothetical protein
MCSLDGADLINFTLFHSINNSLAGKLALCWHMYNVGASFKVLWLTHKNDFDIGNVNVISFCQRPDSHPHKKQANL